MTVNQEMAQSAFISWLRILPREIATEYLSIGLETNTETAYQLLSHYRVDRYDSNCIERIIDSIQGQI